MCGMTRIYENFVQIKLLRDVFLIMRFNLFLLFVMPMHVEVILDPREQVEKY